MTKSMRVTKRSAEQGVHGLFWITSCRTPTASAATVSRQCMPGGCRRRRSSALALAEARLPISGFARCYLGRAGIETRPEIPGRPGHVRARARAGPAAPPTPVAARRSNPSPRVCASSGRTGGGKRRPAVCSHFVLGRADRVFRVPWRV